MPSNSLVTIWWRGGLADVYLCLHKKSFSCSVISDSGSRLQTWRSCSLSMSVKWLSRATLLLYCSSTPHIEMNSTALTARDVEATVEPRFVFTLFQIPHSWKWSVLNSSAYAHASRSTQSIPSTFATLTGVLAGVSITAPAFCLLIDQAQLFNKPPGCPRQFQVPCLP